MLLFWGIENFNLWVFLFAIPGIFSFFQISVTAPIRNEMYKFHKKKDERSVEKIYNNSFLIIIFNILLISIISLIYFSINNDNEFYNENRFLILLVFLITILNLINGNAYTLLTYKGSYALYLRIEIIFNILNAIVIPISYYFLNDFKSTFVLRLSLEFIKTFCLFYSGRNKNFSLVIQLKLIQIDEIKRLIKLSLGFGFDIFSNLIKGPGIIFIIGINNLNFVGLISTFRTIFYYLPLRFLEILGVSFYLEFNNILNSKNLKKEFKNIYFKLICLLIVVLSMHFIAAYFIGEIIYTFWLNGKFKFDTSLMILIVADSIFTSLGIFLILPFKSIHKSNKPALIELIINIIFFLYLAKFHLTDNILSFFKIILFSSIIIFFVKVYYSFKLFKKYGT